MSSSEAVAWLEGPGPSCPEFRATIADPLARVPHRLITLVDDHDDDCDVCAGFKADPHDFHVCEWDLVGVYQSMRPQDAYGWLINRAGEVVVRSDLEMYLDRT